MKTGTRDWLLRDVAIRFRSDTSVVDALCMVTCRNDEVLIELDPDVPDVPLRILGRRLVNRIYQGLAVGPDGELLEARWADLGRDQLGVVTGCGHEFVFQLRAVIVPKEITETAAKPAYRELRKE